MLSRIRWDQRTQVYVQRRTTEGLSKKEIIRCLKRLIARELYYVLCQPPALAHHERDEKAPTDQPGREGAFPDPGQPVGVLKASPWSTRSAASMNDVDTGERRQPIGDRGTAKPSSPPD